jgi:hypothetical protein
VRCPERGDARLLVQGREAQRLMLDRQPYERRIDIALAEPAKVVLPLDLSQVGMHLGALIPKAPQQFGHKLQARGGAVRDADAAGLPARGT